MVHFVSFWMFSKLLACEVEIVLVHVYVINFPVGLLSFHFFLILRKHAGIAYIEFA